MSNGILVRQACEVLIGDQVVFLDQNIQMGAPYPHDRFEQTDCRDVQLKVRLLPRYMSEGSGWLEVNTTLRVLRKEGRAWEIEFDKVFALSLRSEMSLLGWGRTIRVKWNKSDEYGTDFPLCWAEEHRGGPTEPTLGLRIPFPSDEVPADAEGHANPRPRIRVGYSHSDSWNVRDRL